MAKVAYVKTSLTGGGANALDGIDGNILNDGDLAIVFTSNKSVYIYENDDDGGGGENSPEVIVPDSNPGTNNWILMETLGQNYKTIYIPAGAFIPTTTNGAALGTYEYATNDIMHDYYAFDTATEEFIMFSFPLPEDWDVGTIKAQFFWAPDKVSGACAQGETVEWEIATISVANDGAIDTAAAGNQVISDTVTAGVEDDLHISAVTPAITIQGGPARGELVHFKVSRNVGGTDDMAGDAWLFGVWLQLTANVAITTW